MGELSILQLGDPALRRRSEPVLDVHEPHFRSEVERLSRTLDAFRHRHGFGRAISAPQIGIPRRFIALRLDAGPRLIVNPEVVWSSPETFTMWDDCMSFPFLLVRVMRHQSISIRYVDEKGEPAEWSRLDRATSELLQHEIDHLDGILATDRALDKDALVSREVFEAMRPHFMKKVDYVIQPG